MNTANVHEGHSLGKFLKLNHKILVKNRFLRYCCGLAEISDKISVVIIVVSHVSIKILIQRGPVVDVFCKGLTNP
jgi:hypothetical protein